MIRSTLRAAYHVAAELLPVQALRCIVDRDFSDAMYTAATKHDGAEQLNEFEAEQEVLEPREVRCAAAASVGGEPFLCEKEQSHIGPHSNAHHRTLWLGPDGSRAAADELFAAGEDDTPNPYEPALTDDELVAVRGLIDERYGEAVGEFAFGPHESVGLPLVESALRSGGQTYETGPRPKLSTSHGALCRCGHWLHFGNICAACGCNNTDLPTPKSSADGSAQGPADSPPGLTHSPESPGGHSPDVDWLVPAICEVLAEHDPEISPMSGRIDCNPGTEDCIMRDDAQAWREHVAPLIAGHILKAIAAQAANSPAPQGITETFPQYQRYESCVTDGNGRCTRISHDHE